MLLADTRDAEGARHQEITRTPELKQPRICGERWANARGCFDGTALARNRSSERFGVDRPSSVKLQ